MKVRDGDDNAGGGSDVSGGDDGFGDGVCWFWSSHIQRTVSPARTDDLPSTELSPSSGLGVSDQSLSYASWLLRYMAENLEHYVNTGDYLDLDYDYEYVNSTSSLWYLCLTNTILIS